MNRVLYPIIAAMIAVPLLTVIFILPSWFLAGRTEIPVELVDGFLTFDGIMVAATVLFVPLSQASADSNARGFGRSVSIISMEFVASAVAFLLSYHTFAASTVNNVVYIHAGSLISVGLVATFAGLASLLLLMIGTYVSPLFGD